MKTVAICSIKGGVGKTTTAVNLAAEAAATGVRVLLWDLDPQGAATFCYRIKPGLTGGARELVGADGQLARHIRATDELGVHLVPADFSLRHLDLRLDRRRASTHRLRELLAPVADRYDLALIDCAPGLTLAGEGAFDAADVILVPTVPTTLSARTLAQLRAFLAELPNPPKVLAFASMVDRRKALQRDIVAELQAQDPGFLSTEIPNTSVIERTGSHRAPVRRFAPRSSSAQAFQQLWGELAAELWPAR
jgi:chromosome partitioning protein